MTIEFQTQYAVVNDKLIDSIRRDILELSHISREISRAEVILKEDKTIIPPENKMCEIKLTILAMICWCTAVPEALNNRSGK